MTTLNPSTLRRLRNLKQIPSVWEGDRRTLVNRPLGVVEGDYPAQGDCVLWVDGSQGIVRAMDVVSEDIGSEAIVRTLLRAMEQPHSPARPARPQKIVVRDREVQFFLRGVLQDLSINIDYVPELPLIDEIFQSFQDSVEARPPRIPPLYAEALLQKAQKLWCSAPWLFLAEHQVIGVELNRWDVETLYVSIMGMMRMEYGILMYRSLDSLRQFRQKAIEQGSMEAMEAAFLRQDCLFVTYEGSEELDEMVDDRHLADLMDVDLEMIEPNFGNLHPLEGLRSFLHEDEAKVMFVVLDGLQRFVEQHRNKFRNQQFPALTNRYRVSLPNADPATVALPVEAPIEVSVKFSTLPDLADELLHMEEEYQDDMPLLRDDLVPPGAILTLGSLPWEEVELLRHLVSAAHAQPATTVAGKGDGLPVLVIQTSLPKAKKLIQTLQQQGGVKGLGFNSGEDPFTNQRYDLGMLWANDNTLYICGEFLQQTNTHQEARKKWDKRCKQTKGRCGLVVARGSTGMSRGKPTLRDIVALFETQFVSEDELGVGMLRLQMRLDAE